MKPEAGEKYCSVSIGDARKIVAAGHKASAWGWYLADHELVYTMHVHTHVLRDYLQKLPDGVRGLVELQTLRPTGPLR